MRKREEVLSLLDDLDTCRADDLEDQELDFKEWERELKTAVNQVVEMAVCMANGGGGTVVFGVKDKLLGRAQAVVGVPPGLDVNSLRRSVYDRTDPKLTPEFELLDIPEGTGHLLIMQIHPGFPPYTDTSGYAKIRIGKDCQPLTGTLRRKIMVDTGDTDITVREVSGRAQSHISRAALEYLRQIARREQAPDELLKLGDVSLLKALGVIKGSKLTYAGLLLVGKDSAIQEHLPAYLWTHIRQNRDTDYADRIDGRDCIILGLERLTTRMSAHNPITTIQFGMFHFEYRTYPEIALREALMNAFCHADYHIASPILVRQTQKRLVISNPGGFVGGVTPTNILHHPPVTRNPHLVDALTRLRLVNRSNLGIPRMFSSLLSEGKEPPIIEEQGDAIKVTFLAGEFSAPFRAFVAEENQFGRSLSVDHLLILHHLMRHAEIDTPTSSRICQRPDVDGREILSEMAELGYLERGGTGRGTYWVLHSDTHRKLTGDGRARQERRIDWEAAKTRVLSMLKQGSQRGEAGMTNAEVRKVTHFNRGQVNRLIHELQNEGAAHMEGWGRGARYFFGKRDDGEDVPNGGRS